MRRLSNNAPRHHSPPSPDQDVTEAQAVPTSSTTSKQQKQWKMCIRRIRKANKAENPKMANENRIVYGCDPPRADRRPPSSLLGRRAGQQTIGFGDRGSYPLLDRTVLTCSRINSEAALNSGLLLLDSFGQYGQHLVDALLARVLPHEADSPDQTKRRTETAGYFNAMPATHIHTHTHTHTHTADMALIWHLWLCVAREWPLTF